MLHRKSVKAQPRGCSSRPTMGRPSKTSAGCSLWTGTPRPTTPPPRSWPPSTSSSTTPQTTATMSSLIFCTSRHSYRLSVWLRTQFMTCRHMFVTLDCGKTVATYKTQFSPRHLEFDEKLEGKLSASKYVSKRVFYVVSNKANWKVFIHMLSQGGSLSMTEKMRKWNFLWQRTLGRRLVMLGTT